MLVCRDRDCRATFEAEGSREAIEQLRCEDCDGQLHVTVWAAADADSPYQRPIDVRRAA